jgi:beta-lactamase class A
MTRSTPPTVVPFRGHRSQEPELIRPEVSRVHRIDQAPSYQQQARRPRSLPAAKRQRRSLVALFPLVYALRLLILGVGVGAIAGTLLHVFDPTGQSPVSAALDNTEAAIASEASTPSNPNANPLLSGMLNPLPQGQEMASLKAQMESLIADYPGLRPGVFVYDLDTHDYVTVSGNGVFPAASTIKVPVLIAFLQDVDAGKIRLDEMLTMTEADLAGEAGEMQYMPVGTQFTALETAEMMISISDNTATNILIRRLGGIQALNERFRSWGMRQTVFQDLLPDLEGRNTTSPEDLSHLLARVSQGELLSLRSRDWLLEILQSTITDTLIPAGTNDNRAVIAHKTGTLRHIVGDTGLVIMPTGKRYVITVLMERPEYDDRAQELIRQICGVTYDYLTDLSSPAPATDGLPEDAF